MIKYVSYIVVPTFKMWDNNCFVHGASMNYICGTVCGAAIDYKYVVPSSNMQGLIWGNH